MSDHNAEKVFIEVSGLLKVLGDKIEYLETIVNPLHREQQVLAARIDHLTQTVARLDALLKNHLDK